MRIQYPFTAVVGNNDLKTALCLTVLDPSIGGVLVEGDRGSAKSTLARGLGDLLSDNAFVNLPLGASEEQLIGSLDINEVLANNKVKFKPGLLAKANLGVLYIDEVNLLADHLTDVLLDVAASGINIIERDGISHQHEAQFVLIGSMNPDEGMLRPQLLDRFGFSVTSETPRQALDRKQVVSRRIEFEADPKAFLLTYQAEQEQLSERLNASKTRLGSIVLSDESCDYIAELCTNSGCEGLRADITLHKAAKAHAAFNNQLEVSIADVDAVAELVLRHRRKQMQDTPTAKRRPQQMSSNSPDQSQSDYNDKKHNVQIKSVQHGITEKKT